ncbi:SDR family NAD(P)-dependent oxidoreductase [Roseiarcaceae bacterium H3SJ34-1]|uniref:SDR family NAD(P)-dependent oxidoreductase n=1 Tax=Terripilifer ovatus TaxID=3032367 RepID=UPI003AB95440|nr:SDR family NAD(P)-dependent oxidoreductase [Roseiarcaceae bacterium H3SJ34-1]
MSSSKPVAMITGASGNLGRAVALKLLADDFEIVRADGLQPKSASGHQAYDESLFVQADATSQVSMGKAVEEILTHFGRIDALVHTVGGFAMGKMVHETSDQDLDAMMHLNVRSLLATAHAVVPPMIAKGKGSVVFISAATSGKGLAGMGAYIAAKSAVARLTESMSDELRHKGINVNCIMPSTMETPQNRAAIGNAVMVSLEDVANVCAFLVSDGARSVHGASIPVRGLT